MKLSKFKPISINALALGALLVGGIAPVAASTATASAAGVTPATCMQESFGQESFPNKTKDPHGNTAWAGIGHSWLSGYCATVAVYDVQACTSSENGHVYIGVQQAEIGESNWVALSTPVLVTCNSSEYLLNGNVAINNSKFRIYIEDTSSTEPATFVGRMRLHD